MMVRLFYSLILLALIPLNACLNSHDRVVPCESRIPNEEKPNIIIILSDDLGYNDLSTFSIPNIEFLYDKGVVFSNFHSAPVCTPSRISLLTGRYPQNFGAHLEKAILSDDLDVGIPESAKTLFEYLQEEGYKTALFGKWHLGTHSRFSPLNHGFDTWIGFKSGMIDYHNKLDNSGNYDWYKNENLFFEEGYVTDLIAKHAVEYIQKSNSPFALYVPFSAPHTPLQGPDDLAWRDPSIDSNLWRNEYKSESYRSMVESMDDAIGKILTSLESCNSLENTIIYFSSDNGLSSLLSGIATNAPLRNYKASLWEGGVLCPAVFYWPDRLRPMKSDNLSHLIDVLPTILNLIDADYENIDGINLFNNEEPITNDKRKVYQRYLSQSTITQGDFKLLVDGSDRDYLYDLKNDISESRDIKTEQDSIYRTLKKQLIDWKDQW